MTNYVAKTEIDTMKLVLRLACGEVSLTKIWKDNDPDKNQVDEIFYCQYRTKIGA